MGKLGKPLHYSAVYQILNCTFYYGLMKWGGLELMGKHTSLIDKETFDVVQRILREKGQYGLRRRKHTFLLSGFAFCKDCGRRYVAEWHYHPKFKSRNGKIGYYHCQGLGKKGNGCKAPYIQLEDLELQVDNEVSKLEFKPEFIEAVKRNISQVYQINTDTNKQMKKAIYNRRDALDAKRERIDKAMMEGNITSEDHKRMKTVIDKEALDIQRELSEIEKIRTVDVDVISEVLDITKDIAKAFREADLARKKAYLHFFFKEFLVKDKKIVEIKYQPVIDVLQQANSVILSTTWLLDLDSNQEPSR